MIPDRDLKGMSNFLSKLPLCISDLWGYEVRLSGNNLLTDFQICISKRKSAYFFEFLKYSEASSFRWQELQHFASRWCDPGDVIQGGIENIWLEMDNAEMDAEFPLTNFFFAPSFKIKDSDLQTLVEEVFSCFSIKLTPTMLDAFAQCLGLLPSGGWVPQIGMMLARNDRNLRLFIHDITYHRIYNYLSKLCSLYSNPKFEKLLQDLHRYCSFIDLDIDLNMDGQVGYAVGLECYFKHGMLQQFQNFLDVLFSYQLVTTENQSKLLAYVKHTLAENESPASHKEFLHHIKIIYRLNGSYEAKVYLGVREHHEWLLNLKKYIL